jgi:hypothetical protein
MHMYCLLFTEFVLFVLIISLPSSPVCNNHMRIQYIVIKITCIKVLDFVLFIIISMFLFNQIVQHRAATPNKIHLLRFSAIT